MFPASVLADLNGVDLNPVQDTPVATRKEDTYIHFSVDVEIQRHLEKLPKGNATLPKALGPKPQGHPKIPGSLNIKWLWNRRH